MAYIGKVPTAVPLTSSDLADSIVTSAKITDGTITLADLSATGTKDATTFLRGDNTFAEAGGGAYELLSTTNVSSAVATVDFTSNIDSTYKNYLFTYTDVRPVTDGARLELRFFSSAGSPDTGVKYRYASRSLRDNGDSSNAVSGVGGDGTIVTMAYYTGTDADDLLSGQFILHNPAGTDGRKLVHGTSTGMQTDTATFYSYFSANYAETSNAVTGVRFFFNSGNIEKGIFKLYGIN